MARVYSAQHEGLQRQVALKVLTQGLVGSDEHDRFVREARLAAAIKHPNVVNIFDVGVEHGVPYLVMEFLEGEDLDTQLQTKTALGEDDIIDIMVPVVAGLTAVHDAGVIHRDLKPGNIFLTRGRHDEVEPKLLDFGISKASGRQAGKITGEHGLLMGTPFYMAPETIRGADITELSDQYSLGVVMYECATGANPFAADSFAEVVERVTNGTYPPLTQCNTAVSPKLARIVERAMSLHPADRYADLREMGRDLLRLAGQRTRVTWGLTFGEIIAPPHHHPPHPVMPPSFGAAPSLPPTLPPPKSRRGAITALLGATALLAAVVLAGDPANWFRPSDSEPPVATPIASEQPAPQVAQARLAPRPTESGDDEENADERGALAEDSADSESAEEQDAPIGTSAAIEIDEELADEGDEPTRSAKAKPSRRKPTRRPSTRRRAARRSTSKKKPIEAQQASSEAAEAMERPAWALSAPPAVGRSSDVEVGTNNAPILD